MTSESRASALRYRSMIRPVSSGALRLLKGQNMRLKPSLEVSELRTVTLAQLERSLRAASRQGMAVKSITHHPDGRIVIALMETPDETVSVNEWD